MVKSTSLPTKAAKGLGNSMYQTTLLILLTLFSSPSLAKNKKVEAPIKSKEEIEFVSASESPFLDFAKGKDFVGYLNRSNESSKDLRRVDLYTPHAVSETAMNKKTCEAILESIFGDLKSGTLSFQGATLFTGHTGKTCQAQLNDIDKDALYPERHVVVGFIRMKPIALVFRLSKKATEADQQNIKKFWNTLR